MPFTVCFFSSCFWIVLALFLQNVAFQKEAFAKPKLKPRPLILQWEVSHSRNTDQISLIFRQKTVELVTNTSSWQKKQHDPRLGRFGSDMTPELQSIKQRVQRSYTRLHQVVPLLPLIGDTRLRPSPSPPGSVRLDSFPGATRWATRLFPGSVRLDSFLKFPSASAATVDLRSVELDYTVNSALRGVELNFPEEISLKEGKPDLSNVIQQMRRAEESHYDNLRELGNIRRYLLDDPIKELCDNTRNPRYCRDKASEELENAILEIDQNMAGRILYPANYLPPSERSVGDREFLYASEDLDCETLCDGAAFAMEKGSREQYQELYNKLKNKGKQCQEDLLAGIAGNLQFDAFPKQCLEERNKNHQVCKDMTEYMNILQERVSQLADLAYGREGTEAQALCMECIDGETVRPFEKLRGFFRELRDQSQCSELNPGEEKDIRPGNNGPGNSYVLKRDMDGGYSITFPVEFHVDKDYDGPVSKEKAPAHYRNRVQQCLAQASPNLLGPKGEKLKIQIKDPSEGGNNSENQSRCPKSGEPTTNIAIGSKDHRSSSGKYESDIDCPTIVHEVLHLTGLCDEYEEKGKGFYTDPETGEVKGSNFGENPINSPYYDFTPAYDCRVTTNNSIMSNHYTRWSNVESGKNKSLLTPGQFRSILYGSCPEKNKRFNECSRLAYQSSQVAEQDCREARLQCEKENGMGLDKQEQMKALQEEIKDLERFRDVELGYQKSLREEGRWNQTRRDFLKEEIRYITERLQSERESLKLAQSENDKTAIEKNIKELTFRRGYYLMQQETGEEKGLLNLTVGEETEMYLSQIEKELKEAREKLGMAQSWPDR